MHRKLKLISIYVLVIFIVTAIVSDIPIAKYVTAANTDSNISSITEFKDTVNHWAKEAINEMVSNNIISGLGNGMFEPDRAITRAEFATVMVKALKLEAGGGSNSFTDVSSSAWYYDYIKAASGNGIISGYGNNRFGPMDNITREQAMSIIARAMNTIGLKEELSDGEVDKILAGFIDADKISAYAKVSIAACVKLGIVSGRNGNMIAPKDNITRAEAAVIVRNLLQKSGLTGEGSLNELKDISIPSGKSSEQNTTPASLEEYLTKAGIQVYDTFNGQEADALPAGFNIKLVNEANVSVQNIPTVENSSLNISTGNNSAAVLIKTLQSQKDIMTVEFKFMPQKKADGVFFSLMNDKNPVAFIAASGANLVYKADSNKELNLVKDYESNQWYTLKMVANIAEHKADIYVNELPVQTEISLNEFVSEVNAIRFTALNGMSYNIDDLLAGTGQIDVPMGFGAVEKLTIGGLGGETVTVRSYDELSQAVSRTEPMIIKVANTIDMGGKMLKIKSDKTIIGIKDKGVISNGGFSINGMSNIVIRNLLFTDSTNDGVNIQDGSTHIWIDHNTLQRANDGLLDIKLASDFVTVSWNYFRDHGKTTLVGSSDDNIGDRGHLRITYHHNKFFNTRTRHPMVRFGQVHILNNYYDSTLSYAVRSTTEAKVFVEGNYFYKINTPTEVYEEKGELEERNNVFVESGAPQTRGTTFDPFTYYTYPVDNPNNINKIVEKWVGVGQLDFE